MKVVARVSLVKLAAAGVFIFFSSPIIAQSRKSISFDVLYPESWLKKAIDASMLIWADVRAFGGADLLPHERELFVDAIIGRITYAYYCISKEFGDNTAGPNHDDVEYIDRIVNKIMHEYKQLSHGHTDRGACFEHQVELFKRALANYSYTSTAISSPK